MWHKCLGGTNVTWEKCQAGQMSGGTNVMWEKCQVGQMSGGTNVMWEKCQVGQMSHFIIGGTNVTFYI
jgi:paraquat-inducible protein B